MILHSLETQSNTASESMPLAGIWLNVWRKGICILFSSSGNFDAHNTLLKLGRVKELNTNRSRIMRVFIELVCSGCI